MGYNEYLQNSLDYIEEHIGQEITIEECANAAGFSKYHFYRLFGLYVGVPVMDYVRRRKLAYAMHEICLGRRILDVAMDYGYSSERSFSRAFLQEFGKSPSKFRGTQYSIPQKPTLEKGFYFTGGRIMDSIYSEVRFETLGEMTVASAKVINMNPEDEVIAFMMKWADENGIDARARKFGFDVPVSAEEQAKGIRGYEYWISVGDDTKAGKGVEIKKVEGCKYAVLRITDPFSDPFGTIPNGWKRLAEWVNSNGYKASCEKEHYWLEEVVEIGGTTYMDVYFPVE